MIVIKAVTAANVFDVCELTTNADGIGTTMEEWLCCNATSLAEAKDYPEMTPWALYDDATLVGFVMYRQTAAQPRLATICRLMIDHRFQGRGRGKQALAAILTFLGEQGVETVEIMVDDANQRAKHLYQEAGFTFTGKVDHGEYYYRRQVGAADEA